MSRANSFPLGIEICVILEKIVKTDFYIAWRAATAKDKKPKEAKEIQNPTGKKYHFGVIENYFPKLTKAASLAIESMLLLSESDKQKHDAYTRLKSALNRWVEKESDSIKKENEYDLKYFEIVRTIFLFAANNIPDEVISLLREIKKELEASSQSKSLLSCLSFDVSVDPVVVKEKDHKDDSAENFNKKLFDEVISIANARLFRQSKENLTPDLSSVLYSPQTMKIVGNSFKAVAEAILSSNLDIVGDRAEKVTQFSAAIANWSQLQMILVVQDFAGKNPMDYYLPLIQRVEILGNLTQYKFPLSVIDELETIKQFFMKDPVIGSKVNLLKQGIKSYQNGIGGPPAFFPKSSPDANSAPDSKLESTQTTKANLPESGHH